MINFQKMIFLVNFLAWVSSLMLSTVVAGLIRNISEKVQNPKVIVARPSVKTWIHSRFPTPTPTHIALFLLPLQ